MAFSSPPMTLTLEKRLSQDTYVSYTRAARELGYPSLKNFLEREIDKALFALTIPADARPGSLDELDDIDLNEGNGHGDQI